MASKINDLRRRMVAVGRSRMLRNGCRLEVWREHGTGWSSYTAKVLAPNGDLWIRRGATSRWRVEAWARDVAAMTGAEGGHTSKDIHKRGRIAVTKFCGGRERGACVQIGEMGKEGHRHIHLTMEEFEWMITACDWWLTEQRFEAARKEEE